MNLFIRIFEFINARLFLFVVAIPILITIVYQYFLAQEMFTSEASLIVTKNQQSAMAEMGGASGLFGLGERPSTEDGRILSAYLTSYEFAQQAEEAFGLKQHFSSNGFRGLQRLPADASNYDFFEFFNELFAARISSESGVLKASMETFDPELSHQVMLFTVTKAEEVMNELSQRALNEQTRVAREEFEKAREALHRVNEELVTFREKRGVFDLGTEVSQVYQQIARLRSELLSLRVERATLLESVDPKSQQIQMLNDSISTLEVSIEEQNRALVGIEGEGVNTLNGEYELVQLNQEIARNTFAAAIASLNTANLEAAKQGKFVTVISKPYIPDAASSPKSLRATVQVFVVLVLMFFLIKLVRDTIRDHMV
ncbi:MAG: hypothetical protein ACPGN3_11885 [Opitutales bacterium]